MIIVKISLGIYLELLWVVGVSSVSDSSLFQLALVLKVYAAAAAKSRQSCPTLCTP